jgi:hypothetical protein
MSNLYNKLRGWLDNLVDTEYRDVIRGFLLPVEQSSLPQPVDSVNRGDFLGAIQQRSRLEELEKYLQERYPDRFEKISRPPHNVSLVHRVPFTNREDEISQLLSSFAPRYHLLNAPSGYGKTNLLLELKRRFEEKKWVCVYVCADDYPSLLNLMEHLFKEIGHDEYSSLVQGNSKRLISSLGGLLKRRRLDGTITEGVVFLIDLGKTPTSSLISEVVEQFIPHLYINLDTDEFFKSTRNRFRVIVAGRYLASREEITSANRIPFHILHLSPFSYEVLLDLALSYLDHLDRDVVREISAHIMHLSGGHPSCIGSLLRMYKENTPPPEEFFRDHAADINTAVQQEIDQVRNEVPHELRDVMDILSVCRRFNFDFLSQLIDRSLIQYDNDGYSLADQLKWAYLVARKDGFLQDSITRRLLSIRLRREKPAEFIKICRNIQKIYAAYLSNSRISRPEIIAIETLYQNLQLNYHLLAADTVEGRSRLADDFFVELLRCLQDLVNGRDAHEMIANFLESLQSDWEFQFTLNYFLRGSTYHDQPYKKLLKHVDEFFKSIPKKV